jgi:hypothetical protein
MPHELVPPGAMYEVLVSWGVTRSRTEQLLPTHPLSHWQDPSTHSPLREHSSAEVHCAEELLSGREEEWTASAHRSSAWYFMEKPKKLACEAGYGPSIRDASKVQIRLEWACVAMSGLARKRSRWGQRLGL